MPWSVKYFMERQCSAMLDAVEKLQGVVLRLKIHRRLLYAVDRNFMLANKKCART
jgi:hypothetical protein